MDERQDYKLDAETRRYFLATASVPLRALVFPSSRALDDGNVQRLERLFASGCFPDRPKNHIPVIVGPDDLKNEWFNAEPGQAYESFDPPAGHELQCLHGQHRVKAAENIYGKEGRWVVDFFDKAMDEATKTQIREEYQNESPPDDGEFYFKRRLYSGALGSELTNHFLARWWKALWLNTRTNFCSRTKERKDNYDRLTKHTGFASAFDKFYSLKALHAGMRFGSVPRMVGLGCDDLLVNYLNRIVRFFHDVFGGNKSAMEKFSRVSLEKLKGTAPGAYEAQRTRLEGAVRAGDILGEFPDEDERMGYFNIIVENTRDTIFPTLEYFFDNLQRLEPVTDCIKQLLPPSKWLINMTLRDAYRNSSQEDETCWIQTHSLSLEKFERKIDNFELAVRQIWVWAFREHMSLPKKKTPRKANPSRDTTNKFLLHEFAQVADRCGIKTGTIRTLLEVDPDYATALQSVEQLLPSGWAYEKSKDAAILAKALAPHIKETRVKARALSAVSLAEGHSRSQNDKPPRVSGKPDLLDALRDWPKMFLPQLHEPVSTHGKHPSSFFITRSLYFNLFKHVDIEFVRFSPPRRDLLHGQGSTTKDTASRDTADGVARAVRDNQEDVIKLTAELEKTKAELSQCKATPTEHSATIVELDELKNKLVSLENKLVKDAKARSEAQADLQKNIVELAATNAALEEAKSDQEHSSALVSFGADKSAPAISPPIGYSGGQMLLETAEETAVDSSMAMEVDSVEGVEEDRDADERSESLTDFLDAEAPHSHIGAQETSTWDMSMVRIIRSDGTTLCEGYEESITSKAMAIKNELPALFCFMHGQWKCTNLEHSYHIAQSSEFSFIVAAEDPSFPPPDPTTLMTQISWSQEARFQRDSAILQESLRIRRRGIAEGPSLFSPTSIIGPAPQHVQHQITHEPTRNVGEPILGVHHMLPFPREEVEDEEQAVVTEVLDEDMGDEEQAAVLEALDEGVGHEEQAAVSEAIPEDMRGEAADGHAGGVAEARVNAAAADETGPPAETGFAAETGLAGDPQQGATPALNQTAGSESDIVFVVTLKGQFCYKGGRRQIAEYAKELAVNGLFDLLCPDGRWIKPGAENCHEHALKSKGRVLVQVAKPYNRDELGDPQYFDSFYKTFTEKLETQGVPRKRPLSGDSGRGNVHTKKARQDDADPAEVYVLRTSGQMAHCGGEKSITEYALAAKGSLFLCPLHKWEESQWVNVHPQACYRAAMKTKNRGLLQVPRHALQPTSIPTFHIPSAFLTAFVEVYRLSTGVAEAAEADNRLAYIVTPAGNVYKNTKEKITKYAEALERRNFVLLCPQDGVWNRVDALTCYEVAMKTFAGALLQVARPWKGPFLTVQLFEVYLTNLFDSKNLKRMQVDRHQRVQIRRKKHKNLKRMQVVRRQRVQPRRKKHHVATNDAPSTSDRLTTSNLGVAPK